MVTSSTYGELAGGAHHRRRAALAGGLDAPHALRRDGGQREQLVGAAGDEQLRQVEIGDGPQRSASSM
jgi:hypothetical protein